MSKTEALTPIGPRAYASWRSTALGSVTDALEQRLILDLMGELSGRRVLDVGCGDGNLVCATASRGADVTGIDPDPSMLDAARARATSAGFSATFLEGQVECLPFPDFAFDVVVSVTVLCFVQDAQAAIREMARVLRPGGRLVLGELGRWSIWAAQRRVRGWLGSPAWRSARFRTASELRSLAGHVGLVEIAIRGAIYYPPVGFLARMLTSINSRFASLTTFGAAFIALRADAPDREA